MLCGRNHNINITEKHGLERYLKQRGRCHYFKRRILQFMRETSLSDKEDLISLERIDQSIGYEDEKFAWCCLQFNLSIQFTEEIRNAFINGAAVDEQIFATMRSVLIKPATRKGITRNKKRKPSKDGKWLCGICEKRLDSDAFQWKKKTKKEGEVKLPHSCCKVCKAKQDKAWAESPRGFCVRLIENCKQHDRDRQAQFKKDNKKREKQGKQPLAALPDAFLCDVDLEWIVDTFEKMHGRCRTSQYPMVPKPLLFNSISIERKNEDLGHNKANCVLMCAYFQNSHCQWTREMFQRNFCDQ